MMQNYLIICPPKQTLQSYTLDGHEKVPVFFFPLEKLSLTKQEI